MIFGINNKKHKEMKKVKVSKNLYRGRRIWTVFGLIWLHTGQESVAYLKDDGTYMVRPATFFLSWGDETLSKRLGRFYKVREK